MGITREDILQRIGNLSQPQERETSQTQQPSPESPSFSRGNRQRGGAASPENTVGARGAIQPVLNLAQDFNTGLANFAGIFGTVDELLQSSLGAENPNSLLPTTSEIRQAGADIGATRAPGVEATNVVGRFAEEVGAGAVPFLGVAARTATPLIRIAGAELTSAAGATGGGIALENSPAFSSNPYLGRAIGEAAGGVGALSIIDAIVRSPKTVTGLGIKAARGTRDKFVNTFRGKGADTRAARRAQEVALSPDLSVSRMSQPTDVDIEAGIQTPATLTGDQGINKITAAVMAQDPESAETLARTFSEEAASLRALAFGRGDARAARDFIDLKTKEAALKLDASVKRAVGEGATPAESSLKARKFLDDAYSQGRSVERRVWSNLPDDIIIQSPSARAEWASILADTTTATRRARLPSALKKEFGKLDKKTGQLKGGTFPKNPTAKQVHELYSELGDMVRSESRKAGGSANTIRILSNVRNKLMDDLMSVDGGDAYREAITISRNLNDRFTKGTVGNILGFSKSGAGSPGTQTLESILRSSGEGRANAVRDVLEASPETRGAVKEFLRDVFVQKSVDLNKNVLNTNAANKFLKDNRAVLDEFPDLRKEVADAIRDQSNVDTLVGKSNIGDMSLYQKEKSGAAIFMQSNPTEEALRIINAPRDRARLTEDLVEILSEDVSGNALEGAKSSFVESMFNSAGYSNVFDEFTQDNFVNGVKLKGIIDDVSDDLIEGGLFTRQEIGRLKIIADRLSNIQRTLNSAQATGGIISDTPNEILSTVTQVAGAQAGRQVAGATGGGTVQTPGILSSRAKRSLQRLTNDEARNILVRSVKEKDIMTDLLTNPIRLTEGEQLALIDRLMLPFKDTIEVLPSAVSRPAATSIQEREVQQQREDLTEKLNRLRNLEAEQ